MATLFNENQFEAQIEAKIQSELAKQAKNTSYFADVVRQDSEGTWWVRFVGNDTETPVVVNRADMSVGDLVSVTIDNDAHLTVVDSNVSNPPWSGNRIQYIFQENAETTAPAVDFIQSLADYGITSDSITRQHGYFEELEARNITAQSISAATGYIKTLNADEIYAETITANVGKIKDISGETLNYTVGYIGDLTSENITVENLVATTGYIADLTAENITTQNISAATGYIADLVSENITTQNISAATGYIADLVSENITTQNIDAAVGFIGNLTSNNITAQDIRSDHATITTLDSTYATITNLNAATGRITNLESTKADITFLESNYIDADTIAVNYAQANLANVNNAWIQNGVIKDAAIGDAQILGVSANKLTAGTIDAGKINVANLRAKNLIVEKLNGQPVLGGYELVNSNMSGYSSKNPSTEGWYEYSNGSWVASTDTTVDTSKVYYKDAEQVELYDQDYIDGLETSLNQRIDGAVETFTGTAVPTMITYPVSDWTSAQYPSHVGDIYYVVNPAVNENGYCYRFAYDNTSQSYNWVLIKDSDVTKALSDISDLQTFESDTTSWMEETDEGIRTIRQNHTSLSGRVDNVESTANAALPASTFTTFQSTTFKELVDEVDEQSSTITSMSETVRYGGRNYAKIRTYDDVTANGITLECEPPAYHIHGTNTKTNANWSLKPNAWYGNGDEVFESGDVITLSTDVPLPEGLYIQLNLVNKSGAQYNAAKLTGDGEKTSVTATIPENHDPDATTNINGFFGVMKTCGTVDVTFRIKLERGPIATPWDYASEDVTTLTNTVNSVKQTADTNSASIRQVTERVENLSASATNLVRNGNFSNAESGTKNWSIAGSSSSITASVETDSTRGKVLKVIQSVAGSPAGTECRVYPAPVNNTENFSHENAKTYSISFYAKAAAANTIFVGVGGTTQQILRESISTSWTRYTKTYTTTATGSLTFFLVSAGTLYLSDVMLVHGDFPMDWAPDPRDVNNQITTITTKTSEITQTLDGVKTVIGYSENSSGQGSSTLVTKVNTIDETVDGHTQSIQSVTTNLATVANPNLSPYFSHPFGDTAYWKTTSYPIRSSELGDVGTQLDDGWAHIDMDNSSRTGGSWLNIWNVVNQRLKPSTKYTFLAEVRNWNVRQASECGLSVVTNNATSTRNDQFASGTSSKAFTGNGEYRYSATTLASFSGCTGESDGFVYVNAGGSYAFDLRISLYEGDYNGPYKPYVTDYDSVVSLSKDYANYKQTVNEFEATVGRTLAESVRNVLFGTVNPTVVTGKYWSVANLNAQLGWYSYSSSGTVSKTTDGVKFTHTSTNASTGLVIPFVEKNPVKAGEKLTLSFEYRGTLTTLGCPYILNASGTNSPQNNLSNVTLTGDGAWHTYTESWTAQRTTADAVAFLLSYSTNASAWLEVRDGTVILEHGDVAKRLSTAETSISSNAEQISLRATKSEVYESTQPNLSPFFAAVPFTTAAGYWKENPTATFTPLSDGWAHFKCDNTSGSANVNNYARMIASPSVKDGSVYTCLVEIRDIKSKATSQNLYVQQTNAAQFWGTGGAGYIDGYDGWSITNSGLTAKSYYLPMKARAVSEHSSNGTRLMDLNWIVPSGGKVECDIRISLYSGEDYTGAYKPYSGAQLYASQAELKIQSDRIGMVVSNADSSGSLALTADALTYIGNNVVIKDQNGTSTVISGGKLQTNQISVSSMKDADKVVKYTRTEYYLSTSQTSLAGGSWQSTKPTLTEGSYLWQRTALWYANSTATSYTTSNASAYQPDSTGVCTTVDPDIQIGGRNFLLGTGTMSNWGTNNNTSISDGVVTFPTVTADTWRETYPKKQFKYSLIRNQTVTFSVKVKADSGASCSINMCIGLVASETSTSRLKYRNSQHNFTGTGDWQKVSLTLDVTDSVFTAGSGSPDYSSCYAIVWPGAWASYRTGFQAKEFKLELGNQVTDWSPAPEDVAADISAAQGDADAALASMAWKGVLPNSVASTTAAKTVTCAGFAAANLVAGATVTVYNAAANTSTGTVTLNVNSTGAKNIWVQNAVTSDTNRLLWNTGSTITYVYDGSVWRVFDNPGSWIGSTCSVAEGTAAKTTSGCFVIFKGASLTVPMTNSNTSESMTLNPGSLGASTVYHGSSSTSNNIPTKANGLAWPAGETVIFTYDGKFWRTGNQTFIDGGHVTTGTISADRIAVSAIKIGDLNGGSDVVSNASDALAKANYYSRQAKAQQSTTLNADKPWYKFASVDITTQNTDRIIKFDVSTIGYGTAKTGTLIAHIRAGASINTVDNIYFNWLDRNSSIDPNKFVLAYKLTAGSKLATELWCKIDDLGWHGYVFNQIYETGTVSAPHWTLYSTATQGSQTGVTSGYTTVASTDMSTGYITRIDANGIEVHASNQPNNKVKINGDGLTVYKNVSNAAVDVAQFGSSARIGQDQKSRFTITNKQLAAYDDDNSLYFKVTPTSLQYGTFTAASESFVTGKEYQTSGQVSTAITNADANKRDWYAACPTAAATVAKLATIDPTTTKFSLVKGQTVKVFFSETNTADRNSITLNVNSTGAKGIRYLGNGGLAVLPGNNYLRASQIVTFTYDGTYWVADFSYNSDTVDRHRLVNNIRVGENITQYCIAGRSGTGHKKLVANLAVDLTYPIAYLSQANLANQTYAVASGGTTANFYDAMPSVTLTNTKSGWTGTQYAMCYIKGTLRGATFTVHSDIFTTSPPSSDDGFAYIPIGMTYSTTQVNFQCDNTVYAFRNGSLQKLDTASTYLTTTDSNNGVRVHAANNINVNYAQINADGLEVVKGGVSLAHFGEAVRLGQENSYQMLLTPSSMTMLNADGVESLMIDAASATKAAKKVRAIYTATVPSGNLGAFAESPSKLHDLASGATFYLSIRAFWRNASNQIVSSYMTEVTCKTGTAKTIECTAANSCKVTVKYNGGLPSSNADTYSYTNNSGPTLQLAISLSVDDTIAVPAFTLGTRMLSYTNTIGGYSFTLGEGCSAKGLYSFAKGYLAKAEYDYSHADGYDAHAGNKYAHAEGESVYATGQWSHARGCGTSAASAYQSAMGKYNASDISDTYAVIIGDGTDTNSRHNLFTVAWSGITDIWKTATGSDCGYRATCNGITMFMGIGSGGTNHGVYSNKLSKWLIHADASKVYLNGTEVPASPKFTDTTALTSMSGTLAVGHGGTGHTATQSATASVITAGSGITIQTQEVAYWGKVCQIHIKYTYNAAISVPANGNIGNVTVGTLASGYRPKIVSAGWSHGDEAGAAWHSISTGGVIQLGAMEGTGAARSLAASTSIHCFATFILP